MQTIPQESLNPNKKIYLNTMITYTQLDLPEGEELCYTTDNVLFLLKELNIYDKGKLIWLIGIPWDATEQAWEEKHARAITEKLILTSDITDHEEVEKYILKYKTVDKVWPVPMAIPKDMKVK